MKEGKRGIRKGEGGGEGVRKEKERVEGVE